MTGGNGRVAVVTGASSGIGKVTAMALAGKGWRVIATGRDPARSAAAKDEIVAASVTGQVDMRRADLSLMADAVRLAMDIASLTDRIDVLVNNAGGMTDRLVMTPEGLEANFAGNHLGPFLLTERLLPLLRAASGEGPAGSVRILMTGSDAGEAIDTINFEDIQNLDGFDPGRSYCAGKLANMLFTRALATRLDGTGIVAHAMAPGPVASRFYSYASKQIQDLVRDMPMLTEAEGADTLIWLATADEPGQSSGGYWQKRQPRNAGPLADDPAVVQRFWEESEKLIGKAGLGMQELKARSSSRR